MLKSWIFVLLFASIIVLVGSTKPVNIKNVVSNDTLTESKPKYIYTNDTLTEWQLFIMALIEVECERDPNAKSSKNAIGPLQITKIYVSEVNRLYNTNFKFEDAWDLDKSLEMFILMNDYYNPNKDIDKAIQIHNPNAGQWYAKRIKDRMHLIKFNETVRQKLINLDIKNV